MAEFDRVFLASVAHCVPGLWFHASTKYCDGSGGGGEGFYGHAPPAADSLSHNRIGGVEACRLWENDLRLALRAKPLKKTFFFYQSIKYMVVMVTIRRCNTKTTDT